MSKTGKIISWSIVALVVALAVAFSLSYFVYQVPLFDQTGWFEAPSGNVYYWDYYGKPLKGWQTIDANRYYLHDDTGARQAGWLETEDGWYYFDCAGVMQTGWVTLSDGTYYLGEDGVMHTGWLETDAGKYYFTPGGAMQTGWLTLGADTHFFSSTGIMYTGWLENEEGVRYFDDRGVLQTGWMRTEDRRYYFGTDGVMATGFVSVADTPRYFWKDGAYIPLVNFENPVPADYETDPVQVGEYYVDSTCYAALEQLKKGCEAAGYTFNLNSAYRDKAEQQQIWDERRQALMEKGHSLQEADEIIAQQVTVPGYSEHQLGLAVDIRYEHGLYEWLAKHSWEYGFILRFPEGKEEITGIDYEPWHFRYVGKEMAKAVFESGLCLEEYLEKQQ